MSQADTDYLRPCVRCKTRMHLMRFRGGMMFWKCPSCLLEATVLESRMLLPEGTEVDVFVMWKSGTPSREELEALRMFWPPFEQIPIDDLERRFRGIATAELGRARAGDIDWALAYRLQLWVDLSGAPGSGFDF